MSDAKRLRQAFQEDQILALNRLVKAVEGIEVLALPDIPDWNKSPTNAETATPDEIRQVAIAWMAWASKLDDILRELSLEEHEAALSDLQDAARDARQALIELDALEVVP